VDQAAGESDGDYPTASHAHGDPQCGPLWRPLGWERVHLPDETGCRATTSRPGSGSLPSSRCSCRNAYPPVPWPAAPLAAP